MVRERAVADVGTSLDEQNEDSSWVFDYYLAQDDNVMDQDGSGGSSAG